MTTTDKNKLLAEFMGYIDNGCSEEGFLINPITNYDEDIADLKYDTSWDWIMPVAKKCFALNNENDKYESIHYALADLDIDRVYNACVSFVEWYNKQNNIGA